jgi:hypothetical protein
MTLPEALAQFETYKHSKGKSYQYKDDKSPFKVKRVFVAPSNFINLNQKAVGEMIYGSSEVYQNNPNELYDIFFFATYEFPTFFLRFENFKADTVEI